MSKNKVIEVKPEKIPDQLKSTDRWIGWKLEKKNGDLSKVPYNITTGKISSAYDPDSWVDYDTLKGKPQYHLGFAFNKTSFAGVDLDGCRDPQTGELAAEAQQIVEQLNSYTEISPSGTGLHIIVEGKFTGSGNKNKDVDGFEEIEMYHTDRYFTVTGNRLEEVPSSVKKRVRVLQELHDEYFPDNKDTGAVDEPGSSRASLPDEKVLKLARNAKNGDKFERLWSGDTSNYPSPSEADQALCSLLVFYTGPDRDQIDRLFRQSGLVREKWTEREGYRERTINKALSGQNEFYNSNGGRSQPPPPAEKEVTSSARGATEADQWKAVNKAYKEGDKQDARILASEVLQDEREFKVLPEGDQFLVYKPDQGIYTDFGEEYIKARLQSKISRDLSRYEVNEITAHVKRGNQKREKDFGPNDKNLICVKNGVFNLEEGNLLQHSPEYQFRRQIPVKYDPEVSSELLEDFFQETLRTEDDIELIEEIAGYCLYRDYFIQKAFMFVGGGSNGKGVSLDLIENMLGDDNVSSINLQRLTGNNARFGPQFLYKKYANIAGDLPASKLQGTSIFKELTGQDLIDAEVKNSNRPIRFRNYAKMIFSANKVPQSPDDTDAFHRRWILVTFPYKFVNDPQEPNEKQRDPKLREKLNTEEVKSTMFNRAVEGLQRLLRFGRFNYDPTTSEARKIWQRQARPVKAFAEDLLKAGEDKWEFKSKVYKAYKKYCKKNDVPDHEIKQQSQFSKELKKYIDWKDSRPKDPETGRQRTAYDGLELIDIPF